jgi:catechol 2,3-dioxygenase-like lactoylglutathione lyase family enzyme
MSDKYKECQMTSKPTELQVPVGILVASLPAADLAASVSFYSRLLGLELRREFVAAGQVTGCSMSRADLPYALSLRLKSTLPAGDADLSGEHPIIWRVAGDKALEEFREHAERLGLNPTVRHHDDADLVCVIDPDGHDVLVGLPTGPWTAFQGYELTPGGYRRSHDRPRLAVACPDNQEDAWPRSQVGRLP